MTLKTKEKIEPVRHRLENRVKGIIFVCVLAYRLLSVLQWKLKETQEEGEGVSWESAEVLLRLLSRVERMEVSYGKQKQIWYLNVVDKIKKSVRILGYPNLFKDCEIESFEV
jgi:transposase